MGEILYAVTGASGNTGSVVVEELLKQGEKVRAIGRVLERLKPLIDQGAEPFVANLEDADAVNRAFEGVTAAYLMVPPNMQAADFRAYQNRVIDAYVAAVRRNGVKYVVTLSSVGAEHEQGTGPVTGLHDMEQKLNQLRGVNILHLRPAYFMENLMAMMGLIKSMGINGGAVRPDLAMPMIFSRDVGLYAARRLKDLDFAGIKIQNLMGQRDLTMAEATRVIGEAIGKPDLQYVQFSYEDAVNGMVQMGLPRNIAESYTELSRGINEGRVSYPEPRSPETTTPTSFEEFTKQYSATQNR